MSFIKTRKKLVSTAIASSLSVIATTAIAQDDAAQLPTIHTEATQEESLKVDQSANAKFVAPLKDTPKSVSVLSQKLLKETNSNTLLEALRNEPGITLGAGEGGAPYTDIPYIRGYNGQSAIYVDGVRNSSSQNRDMFAIEQVEITKGSSSALSGGSGVGGSINLIPKVAHAGDEYQGTVAGGTNNYKHIVLDANKDFGNGMAGRVIVMGHENEKAGQSDGAEYARVGIAPSIAFGLGSPNRATLSYYFLKSNDEPDSGIPFNNPNNPPTGTEKADGKPVTVKQGSYFGWKDRDFDKRENHIGSLKLEHDLSDDLTVTNISTYSLSKADYIYTNPDDSKGNIYDGKVYRRATQSIRDTEAFTDQLSLAGKFNTASLEHSFNIGAEYNREKTNRGNYDMTYPGYPGSTTAGFNSDCSLENGWCTDLNNPTANDAWLGTTTANKKQTTLTNETVSLYALDSIELNKYWLVNLGARWDKFDTELKYNKDVTSRGVTTPAGTIYANDTDFFSYQGGIVFRPTENGSIYASYATAANPVGIDPDIDSLTASTEDLEPEKARTYEVGTKWSLWNNRANATAAIFRTEKQNTRISIDANTTANAGESKVDGFEVGLTGHITNKWEMAIGYSYLDSEVTKAAYNAVAQEGQPLPFVAKQSANLWTTYQVLPKFTLGAGVQYRDKVFANTNPNTATTSTKILPTFTIYNAMAKYDVNENVNLQLNVNNISDKRYFTSAHAAHYANEGEGRNAVLAINFKY
ncbi:TonB-dependent receptor [Acinetobacter zhairhuonensis]|uniref:TonB-dependent receptor n=1 Tax=Acinetobacter sp. A7.4 TaxID=2919921 RepID=UPI001F4DD327|nr:TonB-dependent siderophore receptor [Acinetobacter sp. A7.4]MCJ8161048.1 TonB-dependent siderophore receptor [Acinetobacter sp. A7.4]